MRSCEKNEKTRRNRYKRDWESTTCESESRKFSIFSQLLTHAEPKQLLNAALSRFGARSCAELSLNSPLLPLLPLLVAPDVNLPRMSH